MANEEHLEILKQGVEVWNRWRRENPDIRPDINRAELGQSKFIQINLREADLRRAYLGKSNLQKADLSGALLGRTNLRKADLSGANLHRADLGGAYLAGANLCEADLSGAELFKADFVEANLKGAYISGAYFRKTDLSGADLGKAILGYTTFGDVDLSVVKGLEATKHIGPSYIDFHTIYHSKGKIPEIFLRGAGVSDTFIDYIPSFTNKPIQFYSCFISYSHKDESLVERLYADLQNKGVRCWYAPEDLRIGDKFHSIIDQSIKLHDKLLIILSQSSINSDWVECEVVAAREEEHKRNQTLLFPVRLDEAVLQTDQAWAADIRRTRHIGDFSRWKDHDAYQQAFERLLRDLKAEG